jgi:soluble lytic murein transglycosylase-like protein
MVFDDVPPRVRAALEQGQAAENGIDGRKNFPLAVTLYCDAAQMGSPEGFFRVGRLLATGPAFLRKPPLANAYLALAASLGHREASDYYDPGVGNALLGENCGDFAAQWKMPGFDMDAYIAAQPAAKRRIAELIRRHAPRYNVDVRVALGVALAESNLDSAAVSPKNAQGVMQLMLVTQGRFGVSKPFDADNNVRGGLAYLKWLKGRYGDDWALIAAAYNTGEGAVARHKGIPPYAETRRYVQRVLYFAGLAQPETDCLDSIGQSMSRQQAAKPRKGSLQEKSAQDACWRAFRRKS